MYLFIYIYVYIYPKPLSFLSSCGFRKFTGGLSMKPIEPQASRRTRMARPGCGRHGVPKERPSCWSWRRAPSEELKQPHAIFF